MKHIGIFKIWTRAYLLTHCGFLSLRHRITIRKKYTVCVPFGISNQEALLGSHITFSILILSWCVYECPARENSKVPYMGLGPMSLFKGLLVFLFPPNRKSILQVAYNIDFLCQQLRVVIFHVERLSPAMSMSVWLRCSAFPADLDE